MKKTIEERLPEDDKWHGTQWKYVIKIVMVKELDENTAGKMKRNDADDTAIDAAQKTLQVTLLLK